MRNSPQPGACHRLLLGLALLPVAGCVQMTYDRVLLGQTQREYQKAFPEGEHRRTESGLCWMQTDAWMGRTDAIVLLLTPDRRVAGKLLATYEENKWARPPHLRYRLVGELSPEMLRLAGAGPIDLLRAVADEITTSGTDTFSRDAQSWVAAGVVRLVQVWSPGSDPGPAVARLPDALERVPASGQAVVRVTAPGVYGVEYTYP